MMATLSRSDSGSIAECGATILDTTSRRRTMKGSAARKQEVDSGDCWKGFRPGDWTTSINVRDFIVRNVTPYKGGEEFLAGPTQRTKAVWAKLEPYFADGRKKGEISCDAPAPSTLLAPTPGF